MKKIVAFFTVEHLLGNLITLLVLGIGIAALFGLKREVFPKVEFDVTSIAMILPGASPEQVEKLLVSPMEDQLREVDGIDKIFSTSTEGTGVIILQLDPDSRDPDKTNDDIQQAVDRIKDLPDSAEDPIVTIADTSKTPIIEVAVSGNIDEIQLREVTKFVRDELLEVKGVASVGKNGFREREFVVEADPIKLAEKRISFSNMINSISRNNVSLPGGSIKNLAGDEILIKTDSELTSEKEVAKTPILSNDEGLVVSISDLATVTERLEEPVTLYRANGAGSVNLVVLKKENADVLDMVERVTQKVEELKLKLPQGVNLSLANDRSVFVKRRIEVLSSNLLIGLVLVVIFLTILLPINVSIVVAVGIPVALFCTIICLNYIGISMNMISMIGMIIVLGMVVDDAIVVCENVWRYYEMNYPPVDAVVKGVTEVVPPVLASVLTTVIAFAPLAFMSGIMGKFISQIPIVVILALIFSLLEAVIIMPSHFSAWVKSPSEKKSAEVFDPKKRKKKKGGWFDKVAESYANYVSLAMRFRYLVLVMMVVGLAASGWIISKNARFILFPPVGVQSFYIKLEAPKSFTLEKTQETVKNLEAVILDLPKKEISDVISMVGISRKDSNDPLTKRGSNYAQVQVILTPENDRDRVAREIMDEIKSKMKLGENIKTSFIEQKGGPPQGRPVSIDILGNDFEQLYRISKELEEILKQEPLIKDIENSYVRGKDQITIKPKLREMASANLTAQEISLNVRAAFDGVIASSVRDLDDEISIRVTRAIRPGNTDSQLEDLKIGNPIGNLIKLEAVAEYIKEPTISAIFHKSYKRMLNVSSDIEIEKTTSNQMIAKIQPKLEELKKKYPDNRFVIGGENEDTKESMQSLMRSFMLAFVGIAALLIITFRKVIQPAVILFTIPMGVIGVIYALLAHGMPLSFMSMLGLVALSGVIVNNAIVLITFINSLREEGLNRYQSIIEAARTRLRPIFMTTITTVSGLLPTAYGWGGSDPFIEPLALALGWGLAIGSVFIALFFPVLISLMDDFYYFLNHYLFRKRSSFLKEK